MNPLISSLRSKVDEILTTLQLSAIDVAKYDIVKAKLDYCFDAPEIVIYKRAQFIRPVQQPNELVDDFISALPSVVEIYNYRELEDEMV